MSNDKITLGPCAVKESETLQDGKAIPDAKQVLALFACFKSPMILDWLISERSRLVALTFLTARIDTTTSCPAHCTPTIRFLLTTPHSKRKFFLQNGE